MSYARPEIERLATGLKTASRLLAKRGESVAIAPNRYMAMESGERYSELLRQDEEIERLAVENARLARELGTERSGHLLTVGERNWCSKETDRLRLSVDGHAETLRGIASMNPATEGERMRQWALDGLSGYTESTESTVKKLMDQIERLRAALGMVYDRWEDGDDCYEDPENQTGYIGKGFQLMTAEEDEIVSLIQGFNPSECPGHYRAVASNVCSMFPHCRCSPEARTADDKERRLAAARTSDGKLSWRGVVPHDPAECGPCEVELREIERNAKPPLGSVSRHDATKFGGRHVELPDDDPPDRHFTMVNGEPK